MSQYFYPDPWVRLPLYVAVGLITEVLFTGIADLVNPMFLQSWNAKNSDRHRPEPVVRDPRALGYTFLWMIPLYALLIFIEPLSFWFAPLPWFVRGFLYLGIFWVGEYTAGALIKKISGYDPWDYSYSRFSFHGHIRWDFAPFWYVFTLMIEGVSRKLALLTPAFRALL